MEDKHRQRILSEFPGESKFKPVRVLDIPDDYQFMDAELIELLKSATPASRKSTRGCYVMRRRLPACE